MTHGTTKPQHHKTRTRCATAVSVVRRLADPARPRRGAVLVVVFVMIALIQLAVISAVAGTADDAEEIVLRVQTLRAFYAAESGAVIAIAEEIRGNPPPRAGDVLELPGGLVEFIETPWAGGGLLVIEGRATFARRRIQIQME